MYSYYNIDIAITIANKVRFHAVHSVRIVRSIEKMSSVAKVELPREFSNALENGKRLSLAKKRLLDYINVGDSIRIEAGYDGKMNLEFEGYIKEIGAGIPVFLECEDEMYKLRISSEINYTFPSASLKKLLEFIAPDYEVQANEMELGKFMISQATPYKVLEVLKKQYGIRSYFNGKVLTAGLPIDLANNKVHSFVFGRNIRKSSNLIYKTKKQRDKWVKAISMQKGEAKNKVVYEFGQKDGDRITLHAPVNLNKEQVKEWADNYYESVVFDGYEGSIESWAEPFTNCSDLIRITDPNYTDNHRDGTYMIETVTTDINGLAGIKRQNKLKFKMK